jgi:tetratricopeptide (TPR) repeat protein
MTTNAYSLFRQGSELLSGGSAHAAIPSLEHARSIEPGKGSIREALGRAYFAAGRFRDADAEFAAALEIEPANDYAHFGRALCLERLGRFPEARGHAKLAVAMGPDCEDYRRALARLAP